MGNEWEWKVQLGSGKGKSLIRPIGDNQRELDLSFVINTTVTQRFIVTFKGKKHFDQIVENGNPVRINISTTLAHNVNLLEIESEGKF